MKLWIALVSSLALSVPSPLVSSFENALDSALSVDDVELLVVLAVVLVEVDDVLSPRAVLRSASVMPPEVLSPTELISLLAISEAADAIEEDVDEDESIIPGGGGPPWPCCGPPLFWIALASSLVLS